MNGYWFDLANFLRTNPYILIFLSVWELIWKGIALWKASQNKQRNWFIALLMINTIGILPIIFLKFFQRKIKTK